MSLADETEWDTSHRCDSAPNHLVSAPLPAPCFFFQIRSRRRTQQRGVTNQPVVEESSDDVTVGDAEDCEKTEG